jgi:hypothetical protein
LQPLPSWTNVRGYCPRETQVINHSCDEPTQGTPLRRRSHEAGNRDQGCLALDPLFGPIQPLSQGWIHQELGPSSRFPPLPPSVARCCRSQERDRHRLVGESSSNKNLLWPHFSLLNHPFGSHTGGSFPQPLTKQLGRRDRSNLSASAKRCDQGEAPFCRAQDSVYPQSLRLLRIDDTPQTSSDFASSEGLVDIDFLPLTTDIRHRHHSLRRRDPRKKQLPLLLLATRFPTSSKISFFFSVRLISARPCPAAFSWIDSRIVDTTPETRPPSKGRTKGLFGASHPGRVQAILFWSATIPGQQAADPPGERSAPTTQPGRHHHTSWSHNTRRLRCACLRPVRPPGQKNNTNTDSISARHTSLPPHV